MNSRLLITLALFAALALLALIGLQRALEEAVEEREKRQDTDEAAPLPVTPQPGGGNPDHQEDRASSRAGDTAYSSRASADDAECLTYAEARRHPDLRREVERLRSVGLVRDDLEAYRHVDETTLETLAGTGDTAAMMVLGQRRLLAGQGRDRDLAVDLLTMRVLEQDAGLVDSKSLDDALVTESLQWFYRAAVHGRVYALQDYGQALFWLEGAAGTPVGLGWMTESEWSQMSRDQRVLWHPGNVYAEVIYDIAPTLATGLSGEAYDILLMKSEETQAVRDRILRRFQSDRQGAGLPSLDVPMSDFDMETFREDLCPGVFERL